MRRRERAEREQRVEALVVEVLVAVRERDAAVTAAEARAGAALDRMVQQERLTVREVVDWCADEALGTREVARLRAVAAQTTESGDGSRTSDQADPIAEDTDTQDTGAEDTGAEDTGAEDTGAEDTGAEDTGAAESGGSASAQEPVAGAGTASQVGMAVRA
ncbi:hypothetical protein [Aquipuribacter hungaricus]|uniref:Uncharacterized protein n=2 Tax=Aquipuribacter hungaricus TaxID=545624 RepID=A0ABV7WBT4_9MICO